MSSNAKSIFFLPNKIRICTLIAMWGESSPRGQFLFLEFSRKNGSREGLAPIEVYINKTTPIELQTRSLEELPQSLFHSEVITGCHLSQTSPATLRLLPVLNAYEIKTDNPRLGLPAEFSPSPNFPPSKVAIRRTVPLADLAKRTNLNY